MKWSSWVTLLSLLALGGLVVYSSLQVGGTRCEVCITFGGRQACRSVDANDERQARMAAITNVCARLASGVTPRMACEATPPTRISCASES